MVKPFDFGVALARQMKSELPNDYVACYTLEAYGVLADMVYNAGDSDYLEIGTWRGTSAIIAVKVKQEYGKGGGVYCVDDFGGYDKSRKGTGEIVKPQAIANMQAYGTDHRIHIIEQLSRPFPAELEGKRFGCLFIDGDHWNDAPALDFEAYQHCIDEFIMFDDDDDKHPAVQSTVNKTKACNVMWGLMRREHASAVFERIYCED